MEIEVTEGTLQEVLQVLQQIPEFNQLLDESYYTEKLGQRTSLMLLAKLEGRTIACKAGYDRYGDGSFYSWLGGVLPEYRKNGIAQMLADYQEDWARRKDYKSIKFKTLYRHRNMLTFAIKNGFDIYNVKEKDEIENFKIELTKEL